MDTSSIWLRPRSAMPLAERRAVLASHGAADAQMAALLAYTEPTFEPAPPTLPLPDEPFVAVWEEYAAEAPVFDSLRRRLVQLRFPIEAGMSGRADYRAAVRRGDLSAAPPDAGLALECPDALTLLFHPTAAGRIPVLIAHARADFEALVRALTKQNEPVPIPASMGACMVAGYNNWDRVARLRAAGLSVGPNKSAYQDRFIILSDGAYSGTPAATLGLTDDAWRSLSLRIRLEHECTHYFTRRALGAMRNSLHDELIADYAGLVAATGRFRDEWFLRFLGLESFPEWHAEGRLANYRGRPPLADDDLRVIASLVIAATATVKAFDDKRITAGASSSTDITRAVCAIASLALEDLAMPDAADRLAECFLAAPI
jgi:hypothetical protein